MEKFEQYLKQSDDYFQLVDNYLAKDDNLQASEKLWGASAQIIKAYAEKKGYKHNEHANLYKVTKKIVEETEDKEFLTLFNVANALHSNFYENWMDTEMVNVSKTDIEKFLKKVKEVINNSESNHNNNE